MKGLVDEFTDLPISRQRKWQLRQEKAGRCITCGQPSGGQARCEVHTRMLILTVREHQRAKLGSKRRNLSARSYSFTPMADIQDGVNGAASLT